MPTPHRQWEPANDAERALLRALRDGDQRAYFQTLAGARLYLPGLAAQSRGAAQQLATWQRDGQTYVLAFTSVEALEDCVEGDADAYLTTDCAALVRDWPDPSWRLAVDPTLPIGAYLRPDEVRRGAAGELTVPTADEVLADAGGPAPLRPANDLERTLAAATSAGDAEAYFDALVTARVLVPTGWPVTDPAEIARPGFPWRAAMVAEQPTIAVFTSPERLAEAVADPVPTVGVDLVAVARHWPDPSYRLAVDPGSSIGIVLTGEEVGLLVPWAQDVVRRYLRPEPLVEKVIAPGDVDRYVRDGYDRVTGAVQPAGTAADGHVIQWRLACPDLYAGSTVDCLLLPHGAQLLRVEGDRTWPVARYDADTRRWERP
jgi:hypothetical protein